MECICELRSALCGEIFSSRRADAVGALRIRSSLLCFCLLCADSLKKTLVKGDARPDVEFIDAKTRFEQYSETLIKLKGNIASVAGEEDDKWRVIRELWPASARCSRRLSCRQPVSRPHLYTVRLLLTFPLTQQLPLARHRDLH